MAGWFWQPLAWLAASVGLGWAWWHLVAPERAARSDSLRPWSQRSGPGGGLRRAYLAGVPLLALLLRVVTAAGMGLVPPRSIPGVAVAGGLALLLALFLDTVRVRLSATPRRPARLRPSGTVDWGPLALDTLCLELWWAFLRACWLAVPGISPTTAVTLGLLVALAERLADPWARRELRQPGGVASWATTSGCAVLSAVAFLLTGSSATSFALHVAVRWLLGRSAPAPLASGPEELAGSAAS